MRLSESELGVIREQLYFIQYPSKHSILLRNRQVFWKLIPCAIDKNQVLCLKSKIRNRNVRHIVVYSDYHISVICINGDSTFLNYSYLVQYCLALKFSVKLKFQLCFAF